MVNGMGVSCCNFWDLKGWKSGKVSEVAERNFAGVLLNWGGVRLDIGWE